MTGIKNMSDDELEQAHRELSIEIAESETGSKVSKLLEEIEEELHNRGYESRKVMEFYKPEMEVEINEANLEKQNFVDYAIHTLFEMLIADQELDHNIEAIGKVRNVVLDVMKRFYHVTVEYP